MIARKITQEQLELAAQKAKVRLINVRPEGRGFRFRLGLLEVNGQPGQKHWRRLNHTLTRKVNAVCWHGHKSFMDAIYQLSLETVIITAFARYDGYQDFLDKFQDTYYHKIGSMVQPCYYGDACECV